MEKWKGSIMAKIIAWIVLSASALCFIFGAAGSVFMIEEGVYNNSKDDIRKQWFEQVSFQYGLSAIDDLGESGQKVWIQVRILNMELSRQRAWTEST